MLEKRKIERAIFLITDGWATPQPRPLELGEKLSLAIVSGRDIAALNPLWEFVNGMPRTRGRALKNETHSNA